MQKILLVTATAAEAAPLLPKGRKWNRGGLYTIERSGKMAVDLLITGPGMVATTAFMMQQIPAGSYDLAINTGICGSLHKGIRPVKVVNIITDRFGDFGAEDRNRFLQAHEMGLLPDHNGFRKGKIKATFDRKYSVLKLLPKVDGITVQKVHGTTAGAGKALKLYGPVMESMEGAAFFYCCNLLKLPSLQIRAVSNMVEARNRPAWKIGEAIGALSGFISLLLMEIQGNNHITKDK